MTWMIKDIGAKKDKKADPIKRNVEYK